MFSMYIINYTKISFRISSILNPVIKNSILLNIFSAFENIFILVFIKDIYGIEIFTYIFPPLQTFAQYFETSNITTAVCIETVVCTYL